MDKLWSVQTMGYYFMIKRNETSSSDETGRRLKCILLKKPVQEGYGISTTDKAMLWRHQKGQWVPGVGAVWGGREE